MPRAEASWLLAAHVGWVSGGAASVTKAPAPLPPATRTRPVLNAETLLMVPESAPSTLTADLTLLLAWSLSSQPHRVTRRPPSQILGWVAP